MKKENLLDYAIKALIIIIAFMLIMVMLRSCSLTNIRVSGSDNTTISTEANRDSLTYEGVVWTWDMNRAKKDTIQKDSL